MPKSSLAGSSLEKESPYFALSQHSPQLPEREEWDKSHENDQTPGEQFMGSLPKKANETSRETFPHPKALDQMLNESKADDKETENDGPEKGGIN
jgi:hypothetical protein